MSHKFAAHKAFPSKYSDVTAAEQDYLTELANDPSLQRLYLAIAEPWDTGAAATTTKYIGGEYTTDPTDTPSSQAFTEFMEHAYSIRWRLHGSGGDATIFSGDATPAAGEMVLSDFANSFEAFKALIWPGRKVRVFVGRPENTFAKFPQIFQGTSTEINWQTISHLADPVTPGAAVLSQTMTVRLGDFRSRFEVPIQTTAYAGTGGLEGGDELAGQIRPLLYGTRRHIEPILVDPTNHVYQIHDGSMDSVIEVLDRGVALTFDTDVADITTATPTAGKYATSLATGYIKLGQTPTGILLVSATGDDTSTFASTTANIIRRIMVAQGGLTDPDELNVGSIEDLNTANSAAVGVYIREQRDISDVVTEVAQNISAFWSGTRLGLLNLGRVSNPDTAVAVKSFTADDIKDPKTSGGYYTTEYAGPPVYSIRLGYRPYDRPLTNEEMGALTDAQLADYAEPYRWVTAEDATVLTANPNAIRLEIKTAIDLEADAQTEATRLLTLRKAERYFYTFRPFIGHFQSELGDPIKLTVTGDQLLGSGKTMIVTEIFEDSGVGPQPVARYDLTGWG